MAEQNVPPGFISIARAEKHTGKIVNIIGVVAEFLEPKMSRGTDWTVSFTLCDKSRALQSTGIQIRVFKAAAALLPVIKNNDDIVILRNIKISQWGGVMSAISTWNTTWAVAHIPTHPAAPPTMTACSPTSGPQKSEIEYIRHLRSWWTTRGGGAASRGLVTGEYQKQAVVHSAKRKFALVRDMQIDCFYDIMGHVVKTFPGNGNYTVYITDYTKNPMLHSYEWGKGSGAGGDGDDYDYTGRGRTGGSNWPGPFGQYALQVTLWDIHAVAARTMVFENTYVCLKNVRAKRNGDGNLEGALHGDRMYPNRVDVEIIKDMNDERVKQVKTRAREYTRRFEANKHVYEKQMQERIAGKKRKEEERKVRQEEGNKNVRCVKPAHPITSIGDIMNPPDMDGRPYVNRRYRIYCRVVDYLPQQLQDFSKPKTQGYGNDSDNEYMGEEEEEGCTQVENPSGNQWVWCFTLLVEGKDGATMKLIVEGPDADHLLKMKAVDLRNNPRNLSKLREKLFILWGDLEERKTTRNRSAESTTPASGTSKRKGRKRRKHNNHNNQPLKRQKQEDDGRPKLDELGKPVEAAQESDGEEEVTTKTAAEEEVEKGRLMFEACVSEYGIQAQGGRSWKRRHRLFGTTIL